MGLTLTREAERLDFHSVWIAEAYGTDAFTPLAWLGAKTTSIRLATGIAQMPPRTPALMAMTATTLDMLTNGRVVLGLGASGPQVVEGWHGLPFGKPLAQSREYIAILRQMFRRESNVNFQGQHFQIPYNGAGATGLGRSLKLIHKPVRSNIPIYLGAMGPKNVALAAEICEGWFPHLLSPIHFNDLYRGPIEDGIAKAGMRKTFDDFDIMAQVYVQVGDDLDACRKAVKKQLALILGGYGAKQRNFYVNTVSQYGYAKACEQIQNLFLSGKKQDAIDAVPNELVDELAIVGPKQHVEAQIAKWMSTPVGGLALWTYDPEALRCVADVISKMKGGLDG